MSKRGRWGGPKRGKMIVDGAAFGAREKGHKAFRAHASVTFRAELINETKGPEP